MKCHNDNASSLKLISLILYEYHSKDTLRFFLVTLSQLDAKPNQLNIMYIWQRKNILARTFNKQNKTEHVDVVSKFVEYSQARL